MIFEKTDSKKNLFLTSLSVGCLCALSSNRDADPARISSSPTRTCCLRLQLSSCWFVSFASSSLTISTTSVRSPQPTRTISLTLSWLFLRLLPFSWSPWLSSDPIDPWLFPSMCSTESVSFYLALLLSSSFVFISHSKLYAPPFIPFYRPFLEQLWEPTDLWNPVLHWEFCWEQCKVVDEFPRH